MLVEERYFFGGLASAQEFYARGGKAREFTDDDGQPCGLDHIGLCSGGRLIDGRSICGDAPVDGDEELAEERCPYTRFLAEEDEDTLSSEWGQGGEAEGQLSEPGTHTA